MKSIQVSPDMRGVAFGACAGFFAAIYLTINRYVYLTYHPHATNYTATFLIWAGIFAGLSLLLGSRAEIVSLKPKQISKLIFNGLLAGIGLGLVAYGQSYTTAVNASIIFSATTIPTVIFSRFLIKERLTQKQLAWMVVMFGGLYFAVVGAQLLNFNRGDLIILLATVFVGVTNTYSKILMKFTSTNLITDSRLLTGGVLFLIFGLVLNGKNFFVTSAGLWPLLAGLFLWLTIKVFYLSIRYAGPTKAVVLTNSHPIITPFIGVLLLGEPYSWFKALGSILLLISVYNIAKKQ